MRLKCVMDHSLHNHQCHYCLSNRIRKKKIKQEKNKNRLTPLEYADIREKQKGRFKVAIKELENGKRKNIQNGGLKSETEKQ